MLRRFIRLDVTALGLLFLASACAGNDARRCKVATLETGEVRVDLTASDSLKFVRVGRLESPFTGAVSGSPIRLVEIQNSFAHNFSVSMQAGGNLTVTSGTLSGAFSVVGGDTENLSIVMTGNPNMAQRLHIDLGVTRSGYFVFNRGETSTVLAEYLEEGDIDVTSHNLEALNLLSYVDGYISANRGALTEDSLYLSTPPNTRIECEIRVNGSAGDCPNYLAADCPSVAWTFNCA